MNYIQSIFVLSFFAGIFAQELIIPENVNSNAQNGFIEVAWDPIIASGFENYNVYRNSSLIGITTSTIWIDNETVTETGYCYNITSIYSNGQESDFSNTACAVWHINPPFDFEVSAGDSYNELAWETPSANLDDVWISYDSGPTGYGIGSSEGPFEFDAAIRFTPQQLENMGATSSYYLTEIRFFPIEIIGCEFSVRVWTGGNANGAYNAGDLLVDQLVTYPIEDEWNKIQLNNPVQIPEDQEIWIGYRIVYSLEPELYPAGTDTGPAVTGYGDLAYLPSQDTWYSLATSFGLNYNWNIQGLLSTSTESRTLASDPLHYEIEIDDEFEFGLIQTEIDPVDSFTLIETVDDQINLWAEVYSREFISYDLYRNGEYFTNINSDINDYLDNSVENLDEYCYHLISLFDEGVSSSSDVVCASPNPGEFVASVEVFNFGSAIKLIWESPDVDVEDYSILRDGTPVGLTSGTTFLDMGELYPGNNYCYEIQAVYLTGPTFLSETYCIDYELNSPYNINVSSGNGTLSLSWENEGVDILEYNIYKDGSYYVSSGESPYVDTGAEEGIAYCYLVAGVYYNGVSSFSNEICGYSYISTESAEDIEVGISNLFTLDMIPPQIDIYSPTDGDHYPLGSNIDLEWYSEDESGFSGDAIDVYLSETLLPYNYYPLIEGLPNTGFALIPTPDISTDFAKIKLYSTDSFGNTSYVESFGLFSIGFQEFIDTLHVESGISDNFVIDQIEPEISWNYPNGGEIFDGTSYIYPQWVAVDPSFDGTDIDIYLSPENGSEFDLRYENISYNTSLELQLDNISTSTALFKITAIDHYGNSSEDTQDNFFSIAGTEVSFTDTLHIEIGITDYFVIDQIIPEVEWVSPNGGESYESSEVILTEWSAIDSSWDGSDATILLSAVTGGSFDTVGVNLPNSGQTDIQLPDVDSESAQFSIYVIDHYGNFSEDFADGFFTIGSLEDSFTDTLVVSEGISLDFVIDQVDPSIELIYPNGGEMVHPYDEAGIIWEASDDSWDGTDVDMWVMNKLGGWWALIDTSLSAVEAPYTADLSEDLAGNVVEEELWGRMRLQAKDHFGNVGVYEYSENYFILGDPEGAMESAYLTGNDLVSLNWGWQGSHLITFFPGALSFLSNYDVVNIIDENAIINSFCDGGTGYMQLASFSYNTEYNLSPLAVKTYEGADYCEMGGDRYAGYVSGNPIVIEVVYAQGGTSILTPDMGTAYFIDEITVIESFEGTTDQECSEDEVEDCSGDGDCCLMIMIGDGFADCEEQARDCDLTCYENDGGDCGEVSSQSSKSIHDNMETMASHEPILLSTNSRGRDFDDYNIYRSTNMANLRECGGTCGTCSDGITFNEEGCVSSGYNWESSDFEEIGNDCVCLIADHTQQTWYFDNFSMTNTTWCYHVWLMDEETKLVKTVDSCLGIEIMVGDVNGDGSVNILDVVSIVGYMTDQVVLSDDALIAADFNGDGSINVLDIVMMLEYILTPL